MQPMIGVDCYVLATATYAAAHLASFPGPTRPGRAWERGYCSFDCPSQRTYIKYTVIL